MCAYRTSIDSKRLERLQDVYVPRMQVRLQAEEGATSLSIVFRSLNSFRNVSGPSSRLEFQGGEFQHHAARIHPWAGQPTCVHVRVVHLFSSQE